MTEDMQFVCGACGNDYEGDASNVMTHAGFVEDFTTMIVWMNNLTYIASLRIWDHC